MAMQLKDLKGLIEKENPEKESTVPGRIITLGKVLMALEKVSRRDALWILRRAIRELGGK